MVATRKAEARKQLLVGDLHMKQGQARSAVDAYQQATGGYQLAAELKRQYLRSPGKEATAAKDVQAELEIVEAATKLAEAGCTYMVVGPVSSDPYQIDTLIEVSKHFS